MWNWPQMIKIAAGAVAFGVLMSIRTETDEMWIRAALAACAGGALAVALWWAASRKN
jgi:hypothetical protein